MGGVSKNSEEHSKRVAPAVHRALRTREQGGSISVRASGRIQEAISAYYHYYQVPAPSREGQILVRKYWCRPTWESHIFFNCCDALNSWPAPVTLTLHLFLRSSIPHTLSMKSARTTPLSRLLMTSRPRLLGDGAGEVCLYCYFSQLSGTASALPGPLKP